MKKPENQKIDIVILDKEEKVKASKILRAYTKQPYKDLIMAIENSQPITITELVPENFYQGIKEVINMIEELDSNCITWNVFANKKIKTKEHLININQKIENLALKDFR